MAGLRGWIRGLFGKAQPMFVTERPRSPIEPSSFGESDNALALAMYGLLRKRPGNILFSPFSVRTVLAMARVGARGETREQMNETLRFSSGDDAEDASLGEVIKRLNAAGGGQYEMTVANSLWSQEGAPLQAGFVDVLARRYEGGLHLVDFRGAAEAAGAAINRWIEEKTRQRIRDLIPRGTLNAETRLVLANAVYFKGKWALPFSKAQTSIEPFYLEGRTTVQVPLMRLFDEVAYLEAPDYQLVEMEYGGGELSMLVILPDEKDGLPKLEKSLSVPMLRECLAQAKARRVGLLLPRFKIAWGAVDLCQDLAALGMPLAFTDKADFSGINGLEPPSDEALYISVLLHKALIEVTEEGTEAVAATGISMVLGLTPHHLPPIVRADHPFLFAIRDRKSGAILFLGRMVDPTRES